MRLIEDLKHRIALLITKTLIESVDDSGGIQKLTLTGFAGDRRSGVDRYQEFGFASVPPDGSEAIMLSLGGSRSHNIAIATEDRRYRPTNLGAGESMLYNQAGDYVKVKASGEIEIKSSSKLSIVSPVVEMSGNLTVTGAIVGATVTDGVGSMGSVRAAYNSHTHAQDVTPGHTGAPTPGM